MEAAELAIKEAAEAKKRVPMHIFSGAVEHALAHIEEAAVHGMAEEQQRWYAVKIFERDAKVLEQLSLPAERLAHIEADIVAAEKELDDDAESIIAGERYNYIEGVVKKCYYKKHAGRMSISEKIDRVVTNRFAALPIFALIMFLVYFISVTTVGTWVTDFTNDGLFGDGFHLLGIGGGKYDAAVEEYVEDNHVIDILDGYVTAAEEAELDVKGLDDLREAIDSGDIGAIEEAVGSFGAQIAAGVDEEGEILTLDALYEALMEEAPAPADYGVWVPGVPVLLGRLLDAMNCAPWLESLVLDGIVAGVGAVLGFTPQILVLFILLAFLEACGYMARIAFVLDRIFRKFGLSGKSFIPMLIGTGCGVPGIMASRTIENDRDRRMTVMTTTFIPCGAKLPIIALIASALFDGAWWVAPVAYFVGIAAVIVSGIMLKKTKMFAGEPSTFVMELPAYHMPTFVNVMRSMWERGWSFIKKAGSVILLSTIFIWAGSKLGVVDGRFAFDLEMELSSSLLGYLGNAFKWLFAPLGFATIEATVATFMGLLAKEEVVAVLGVLDFLDMTKLAGFSFLIFNLLCAPCFAAMGAIRREMNSAKWTWFAIGYQCAFAWAISLIVYQLGMLFTGNGHVLGTIVAFLFLLGFAYFLARPDFKKLFGKKDAVSEKTNA